MMLPLSGVAVGKGALVLVLVAVAAGVLVLVTTGRGVLVAVTTAMGVLVGRVIGVLVGRVIGVLVGTRVAVGGLLVQVTLTAGDCALAVLLVELVLRAAV